MKTIAVDDELWMLKRFELECAGIETIELLATFRQPLQALRFAGENMIELAFLDVEMPELNGLELAGKLRELYPDLVVIFVSAYERYKAEAYMNNPADGFVMKPYGTGEIVSAIDRALLITGRMRTRIYAHTFGVFSLLLDGDSLAIPGKDTLELLALLVDACGSLLDVKTVCATLWPDELQAEVAAIRYRTAVKRLLDTLSASKLDGLVVQHHQGVQLRHELIDGDIFRFLSGDPEAIKSFHGEYMSQYVWADTRRRELQSFCK